MKYLHKNFFLSSPMAQRLFHEVAKEAPIYDYHCHLSPAEIAHNHRWENITDLWLGSDHYKWRLMRANGIAEHFVTGDASPREKFQAWAETMPYALRNPMHHWVHLELRQYFGIEDLLCPASAESIWERCNHVLQSPDFCVHGLLQKFRVAMVGTTDDPADSLDDHWTIRQSSLSTKVLPTFRPDKAFAIDQGAAYQAWIQKLAHTCGRSITTLEDLLAALKQRHDDFHAVGGRMSDHSLDHCPTCDCDEATAAKIFRCAMAGDSISPAEKDQFTHFLMVYFGELDAAQGWTKQLHLGPFRNTNSRLAEKLGPDRGFDTIGDSPQGHGLVHYLDTLSRRDSLPGIILYNINPRDNYLFAALTGAFQDGSRPGKIQFGSGWWFLDQKDGMEQQLNALSSTGLLSRFVGMLTDSRSFLSFPRHEYFRRILCEMIGTEADRGELPDDFDTLAQLVRAVCSENAKLMIDP
ncbi:MAG: glucuronate isomerase [Verrucomicrobia bacterium]|nr:MAG: glucuronate isomerase [Verrucomicrobiota bacterium]